MCRFFQLSMLVLGGKLIAIYLFSYTYDLTNTLQTNLTRPSFHLSTTSAVAHVQSVADHPFYDSSSEYDIRDVPTATSWRGSSTKKAAWGFNDTFVWNHFLLRSAFSDSMALEMETDSKKERSCWVLPLVHGFVDQASK